jgi:hypothetical protein
MTRDDFHDLVMSLPGVETGTSYGHPSYKLGGKFFTRVRAEDDSAVLQDVSFDERELLLEAEPDVFHFTDHYRSYPMVLARLGPTTPERLRPFLERRWRTQAPKKLQKALSAAAPGP